jgi:hypothetical protein
MTRLSKTETYAILWLNSQNNLPEDIAKQLGLNLKQVTRVIEKNCKTSKGSSLIKTVSESAAKNSKSKNLMITHTRDKKTNNVSVMTREASALNDELKKSFVTKRFNENTIFRPNGK